MAELDEEIIIIEESDAAGYGDELEEHTNLDSSSDKKKKIVFENLNLN